MKSSPIRLIVGLGNPGPEYEQTPHNAGFWLLDEVARHAHGQYRNEGKFHGEACKVRIAGEDCWLLKPTTFMNRSGQAVAALAGYYKISPAHILVAHDELDFEPGTARLKYGGGHGGHNGLRDIIPALGSNDFYRLRLGVGHPGRREQVTGYLLGRASKAVFDGVMRSVDEVMTIIEMLVRGETAKAAQKLHTN